MLETDVLYANYTRPGEVRVRRSKNQALRHVEDQVRLYASRNKLPYTIVTEILDGGVTVISWKYEEPPSLCKHKLRLISVEQFFEDSSKVFRYQCQKCGLPLERHSRRRTTGV